jgi:hypothetical protein
MPFVPLVALAHVHNCHGALGKKLLGGGGIDFVDLGLGLLQQLTVGRHNFTKYSNLASATQSARATLGTCLRASAFG